MSPLIKCDQCTAAMINGVFCHETGCPNRHKDWDPEEGCWVEPHSWMDDYFDEEEENYDPDTD